MSIPKASSYSLSDRMDRDKINSANRDKAAANAHAMLDPVNNQGGEDIIAAGAVLFAVLSARSGLSAQELHSMGSRILKAERFHDKANVQLEALQDFAGLRARNEAVI